MSKFVNIDGNQINVDSIRIVHKIKIGGDNGSMFNPKEYIVFYVEFDGGCLRYSEEYQINYWTRSPKLLFEKDDAYRKLTQKRNEILTILGITE